MGRRIDGTRDVTQTARRAVDKTIEELLALGETNFDHLSFRVHMEWGPGGALVVRLEPTTGAARSLLTRAVARAIVT